MHFAPKRALLALWLAALPLAFAGLVAARHIPGQGLTALIQFDAVYAPRAHPALAAVPHHVRTPTGYDGQFYAQLALDPTLRDPRVRDALDAPAYRARRIFLPALAYALGAGAPARVINIYAWLNLAFWLGLWALLWKWCPPVSARALAAHTVVLFSAGTLESVRLALTDLPATVLILVGALAAGWRGRAPLAFACLARETSLLAVFSREWGPPWAVKNLVRQTALALLVLLPMLAWNGYVAWRYGAGTWEGRGNFSWPGLGVWDALAGWTGVLRERFSSSALAGFFVLAGLYLQLAWLLLRRRPEQALWRLGVAYGALLLVLGPSVWEMPAAACRAVLPLTAAFNLLLFREEKFFWPWLLAGNAFSLYGVWRFATYAT